MLRRDLDLLLRVFVRLVRLCGDLDILLGDLGMLHRDLDILGRELTYPERFYRDRHGTVDDTA